MSSADYMQKEIDPQIMFDIEFEESDSIQVWP